MRFAYCTAAIAALLCALCAGRAAGQQSVWLVQPGQQRAPWYARVRTAVEAEGIVVSVGAPEQPVCEVAECARELARSVGASRAVLLRVDRDASHVERVTIELAVVEGPSGQASVEVTGGGIASATRRAYRQAELSLALGDMGMLLVTSTPVAALVSLDGEPIGHAPLQKRLSPGAHRIALSLDGFVRQERRLNVERGRASDVVVRLLRAPDAAPSATRTETSPLNYIVGAVLVAASVPALGSAIRTLALDGDCARARDASGACAERVHFGARSGALFALGAAALIGGCLIMLEAPFTIEAQADQHAARVGLAARF